MKSLQSSPAVSSYVPDEKNGHSSSPVSSKLQGSVPHLGNMVVSCTQMRVVLLSGVQLERRGLIADRSIGR